MSCSNRVSALPNLADLLNRVRRGQHAAIMKKADSVNKTSSDSFNKTQQ